MGSSFIRRQRLLRLRWHGKTRYTCGGVGHLPRDCVQGSKCYNCSGTVGRTRPLSSRGLIRVMQIGRYLHGFPTATQGSLLDLRIRGYAQSDSLPHPFLLPQVVSAVTTHGWQPRGLSLSSSPNHEGVGYRAPSCSPIYVLHAISVSLHLFHIVPSLIVSPLLSTHHASHFSPP